MFTENLHSDTTEENLYKLFGLRSTQYLKQNWLVNIPLINKTGKSKRFAFKVTPEKVHQDLLKLDGIDFFGRKRLIKETISTRKKDPKQSNRPNFVVNNFPKNQDLFKRPELYLATSCMRQPSVSLKSKQHIKKEIIQDNHKESRFL